MAAEADARRPVRRPTAADVARAVGLSRSTVGYVLNNTPGQSIPDATRQRVLQEAARIGYRPHAAAQALARGSSRTVLYVLPDWPAALPLQQHLDETALVLDRAGYSLVTWIPQRHGRARPLWETLDPDVVIGLVPFDQEQLDAMRAAGVQRVYPHRPATGHLSDLPGIANGSLCQVEHLAERGHTIIAFAGTHEERLRTLSDDRRQAVRRHARRLGLKVTSSASVHLRSPETKRKISRWLSAGVTAVATFNDDTAAAVLAAALDLGVRVPDDLAVIGHDDSLLAMLYRPPISSIRIDYRSIGHYMADVALATSYGARPDEISVPSLHAEAIHRRTT